MMDYDALYRRCHPRMFPYSPFERQRELRDLWPADQREFKRLADTIGTELLGNTEVAK